LKVKSMGRWSGNGGDGSFDFEEPCGTPTIGLDKMQNGERSVARGLAEGKVARGGNFDTAVTNSF
jgi:hypothetical protein